MKTPLTELLAKAANVERSALDQVFAALYPRLRDRAGAASHARRRRASGHHLARPRKPPASRRRVQAVHSDCKDFFTYAAKTTRNIAIDFAREQRAQRRGGGAPAVALDTALGEQVGAADTYATLRQVNDALLALDDDPARAQIVEMRYFAGYSEAESANSSARPSAPCAANGKRRARSGLLQ